VRYLATPPDEVKQAGRGASRTVCGDSLRKLQTSELRLLVSDRLIILLHNQNELIIRRVACNCTSRVHGLICSILLILPSFVFLFSSTASGKANSFILIHSILLPRRNFLTMGSKYEPIQADEKFHDVFPTRTSTSESLGSTLLEDEEDSRNTVPRSRFRINWMWLVHALLLTLSFGLFVSAYFTRASTLSHVQHFSAYCKLKFLDRVSFVC
jgi:hypothetical protein